MRVEAKLIEVRHLTRKDWTAYGSRSLHDDGKTPFRLTFCKGDGGAFHLELTREEYEREFAGLIVGARYDLTFYALSTPDRPQ